MPKRKKPFAANLASRNALELDGWTVGVVETRIPHTFITRGAFANAISELASTRDAHNQTEAAMEVLIIRDRLLSHFWIQLEHHREFLRSRLR